MDGKDRHITEMKYRWTYGWMEKQIDKWMDSKTYIQMNDIQKDGRKERQTDRCGKTNI